MLSLLDRRDDFADVDAVLDHAVAGLVILERDLVPDRDIALRLDLDVLVVFHDPAGELLACLDAFDDDDADAVAFFVDNEMNHRGVILFACSRVAASCRRSARFPRPRRCRRSARFRFRSAWRPATRRRTASCSGHGFRACSIRSRCACAGKSPPRSRCAMWLPPAKPWPNRRGRTPCTWRQGASSQSAGTGIASWARAERA